MHIKHSLAYLQVLTLPWLVCGVVVHYFILAKVGIKSCRYTRKCFTNTQLSKNNKTAFTIHDYKDVYVLLRNFVYIVYLINCN